MNVDILFVCDAHAEVGLGHGSRCAKLLQMILKRNQQVTFAFQGTFSDGAKNFMSKLAPDVPFLPADEVVFAATSFLDRMVDPSDKEAWSGDVVERLSKTSGRVLYMASGATVPSLPKGVICVGYQPGKVVSVPPYLFWGLEYAPAHREIRDPDALVAARDPGRALVTFGGAPNDGPSRLVIEALSSIDTITNIDLLTSPVNAPLTDVIQVGNHQTLHQHRNSDPLPALLERAGVVITSFGNLGYEALATGAPLCFIGQKQFQVELAELLENKGLAVSAGLAGKVSKEATASAVRKALRGARELSDAAQRMIDGQGLMRIANIIAPNGAIV